MSKRDKKTKKGIPEIVEKPLTISTGKTYADICSKFKNELNITEDVEKPPGPTPQKPRPDLPDYRIFEQPFFGTFTIVEDLEYYYPTNEMKVAQGNRFENEFLAKGDKVIEEYLSTTKLTVNNIGKIFGMLIQIEDLHTMLPYCSVYLENVVVSNATDTRLLKFNINVPSHVNIDEILNPIMDEVVFVPLMSRALSQHDLNYPVDLLLQHPHESLDSGVEVFREVGILDKLEGQTANVECSNPRFDITKKYDIIFRSNRVHVRYQHRALELLNEVRRAYLFPNRNPYKKEFAKDVKLQIINRQISENPEQLQAVKQIVGGANPYAPYIVVGPPGTGKTTTIVEAILQLYINRPKCHILITASTNSACDTIALKLCELFENNPLLRKLSLQRSGFNFMGRRKPPTHILRVFSKSLCKKGMKNISRILLDHSNFCKRKYESPSVNVLRNYNIIVVTLITMGRLRTGTIVDWPFTHVFIDEAGATMETEALIAITSVNTKSCRVILSGDTKQLGPVVMSPVAAELGLKYSLMERLLKRHCYAVNTDGTYDYTLQTRLRRNFRSHPAIVHIYNHLYYDHELLAKVNLANLLSSQNFPILKNKNWPVIFMAVYGKLGKCSTSCSSFNQLEINAVVRTIQQLRVKPSDIGVISPYKLQCTHIKRNLKEKNIQGVEVGTVELFQGREKPIIIASFVKSFCNLGFTADPQRLNVVLSRAQSLLILIGNPKTLQRSDDFEYIIQQCTYMDNFKTNDKFIPRVKN
ncbi:putative helicase MOV-10 [Bactrocera tryoni]|uniref:putative helicase MOV-10 n=1 Tax=Bactrocera tryoni TaxID=59916 RepID=UPI001A974D9B|nr:putative helicase MOV-10 [Bactrocera tryoni]